MKRTNVKGNTWILEGPQLVGLYQIDEKTCLLFDPGSTKLRPGIEAALQEAGLTPVGVVCTHMHYDHHETTRYFRDTYGAQTCLPQLEADIVRCEQSLKNHLFNFTMGMVRTIPGCRTSSAPWTGSSPSGRRPSTSAGCPWASSAPPAMPRTTSASSPRTTSASPGTSS